MTLTIRPEPGPSRRLRARVVGPSLFAAALLASAPAAAENLMHFEGRIEAVRRAEIATELNGIVAEVLFSGGESVARGDPLVRLDPAEFAIALEATKARVAAAEANLQSARRQEARSSTLGERGVLPTAEVNAAATARAVAEAELALALAEERHATLMLERTVIRAPIDGRISRPEFAIGRFLEAEAGPPLATIVQLDPVLVAYDVPYADRLRALKLAGAETVEALLKGVSVTLTLPDGSTYPGTAEPRFYSAEVNPLTGTVTIWAEIANPDGILRPGLAVRVNSDVTPRGAR